MGIYLALYVQYISFKVHNFVEITNNSPAQKQLYQHKHVRKSMGIASTMDFIQGFQQPKGTNAWLMITTSIVSPYCSKLVSFENAILWPIQMP